MIPDVLSRISGNSHLDLPVDVRDVEVETGVFVNRVSSR